MAKFAENGLIAKIIVTKSFFRWWAASRVFINSLNTYTYIRNIFTFLDSDNSDSKGITKLGNNTELDGTGISAPMFTRDVSLGCHFIMAEFARITGAAKGTSFHNHCFS